MWASDSRFSAVDFGAGRMKFWEGGLKSCPSCSGSNISHSTNCAGIRRNGDGYMEQLFIHVMIALGKPVLHIRITYYLTF